MTDLALNSNYLLKFITPFIEFARQNLITDFVILSLSKSIIHFQLNVIKIQNSGSKMAHNSEIF